MRKIQSFQTTDTLFILLVVFLTVVIGLYWIARYGGWVMEVDASRQTVTADAIIKTGGLENDRSYENGFAYSSTLAFLSLITGGSVQEIQLNAGIWVFVVALVAIIAYRELLGNIRIAALAAVLLILQPDFLFYVMRSAHEKVTWTFALIMIFLLARSYHVAGKTGKFIIYTLIFYGFFFAMAASNAYFASTFIIALSVSFTAGWVLDRFTRRKREKDEAQAIAMQRLMVISLACLTVFYVLINYVYPPALLIYEIFTSVFDRLGLLVLAAQSSTPASYAYFEAGWRSTSGYLLLTSVQWIIALTGVGAWFVGLFRFSSLDRNQRFLWLMYSGFAFQLVLGVVLDFTGFLSTNLQLRIFTPFALFSSPMAASLIYFYLQRVHPEKRKIVIPVAVGLFVFASLAVVLKITNDPIFGNQWMFYSPADRTALQWTEENVKEQHIWVHINEHYLRVVEFWRGYQSDPTLPVYNIGQYEYLEFPPPYFLISDLVRIRANRMQNTLPGTIQKNLIYDNGTDKLYYDRSYTPYQR